MANAVSPTLFFTIVLACRNSVYTEFQDIKLEIKARQPNVRFYYINGIFYYAHLFDLASENSFLALYEQFIE
jgi:hypothetical protein